MTADEKRLIGKVFELELGAPVLEHASELAMQIAQTQGRDAGLSFLSGAIKAVADQAGFNTATADVDWSKVAANMILAFDELRKEKAMKEALPPGTTVQ